MFVEKYALDTSPDFIKVNGICKSFNGKVVLENVTFDIEKSAFVSIFGPNASGKTTLLNIISGLLQPDNGGIDWYSSKEKVKISYVFQDYRETLFPWRKIIDNIALPLKLKGWNTTNRHRAVHELIEKFDIDLDLQKYPYQLSGGQQQLTAILRGVIITPDLLLLDEPFSAIDFQRRIYLHEKIIDIWEKTKATIVFISHDLDEAIYLADKIILIGGKPTTILNQTKNKILRPRKVEDLASDMFIKIKKELLECFLENAKILN